jgi:tRNA-uridine 2-sulfurtransferase
MSKILAAMSGGVDSSVAAARLVDQGHHVVGAYMKNWINEENILGDCPWEQDIADARRVADQLGVEFHVINFMDEYRQRVVHYLLQGYQGGITPNPDVMCNREMKFGVFLDHALDHGFSHVATGHYARRLDHPDRSSDILTGVDQNKNQSYFLALLQQRQIRHALFPIGDTPKPDLRTEAARRGLATATKKDSQGICFIGQVKMSDFLTNFVPDDPGPIVDTSGNPLGEHRGLHLFTLGQRRGIGVPSNTDRQAYVVVAKRPSTKELVVAFDQPSSPGLYATSATLSSLSSTRLPFDRPLELLAQPRYRSPAVPATLTPLDANRAHICFHKPQRALTPGQICAFYSSTSDHPPSTLTLLGGAVFEQIET